MTGRAVFTGFLGPGREVEDLDFQGIESVNFDVAHNVVSVTKDGRVVYFSMDDLKNVIVARSGEIIEFFVTNE